MAAPTFSCNLNSLITASACFRTPCLSVSDRKAIDIYMKVRNLVAIGGTNYVGNEAKLTNDAATWAARPKETLDAIDLYVDYQNALNDGAALPATIKALIAAPHCFRMCVGMKQLNGIQAFLKCSINSRILPD